MTDQPGTPSDAAADAAWFRSQVDPVVGADPVTDAWPLIEARATESAAEPIARQSRSRWLAAAAAVLLLAAGVAILAARGEDRDTTSKLTTEPPTPTGWYVPVGLPDGWQLEAVEAHPGRKVCERHGAQWTDPERGRSLLVEYDACGTAPTVEDLPDLRPPGTPDEIPSSNPTLHEVDLGGGVTASGIRTPNADPDVVDLSSLSWNDGGGAWTMGAVGLGYEQQVAVAKRLVTDPDRTDLGIAGLREVDRWSAPARDRSPEVQLLMTNPDGLMVAYHLALPGGGIRGGGSSVLVPVDIPGQPNQVLRYDAVPFWAVRYGGAWPGADVNALRLTTGPTDAAHLISDADVEQLLGSLRPATSEQWQAFLAMATKGVSPVLLDTPTLESLAADDFPRPGEPGAELVVPTATTATSTTATSTTATSTTAPTATTADASTTATTSTTTDP